MTDLERFFKWFDLYAYPCFYCSTYFNSTEEVFAHIHASHLNQPRVRRQQQPSFEIIIKTEPLSSNDDDDG